MNSKDYKRIIIEDYPASVDLFEAGLISERNAEIYCIQKRFREIMPECENKSDACYRLSEEFPKSEKSIYNYIRSVVI